MQIPRVVTQAPNLPHKLALCVIDPDHVLPVVTDEKFAVGVVSHPAWINRTLPATERCVDDVQAMAVVHTEDEHAVEQVISGGHNLKVPRTVHRNVMNSTESQGSRSFATKGV